MPYFFNFCNPLASYNIFIHGYWATFDFENTDFEDWDPREMVQDAAGHWRDVERLSVIEVMARSSELAAALADNDPALFTEYTVPVFSGHVGTGLQGSIWDFNLTRSADDPTYAYLNLQTDGFAPAYADPDLTNNQAHHTWYWLQVAYYNSTSLAIAGNIKHEVWDVGGRSVQDFNSGMFGIVIGDGLKTGSIRPSNIGGHIRSELGLQVGFNTLVGTLAGSR